MTALDDARLARGEYLSVTYRLTDLEGADYEIGILSIVAHPDQAGLAELDLTDLATVAPGLVVLELEGDVTALLEPGPWRIHTWVGSTDVLEVFAGDLALRVSPSYIGEGVVTV